ncbi:MAG: DinB family protein [Gemmatimonadetes bacterium]|nr:DinB family protein [Gemmatimonadota bacterium]
MKIGALILLALAAPGAAAAQQPSHEHGSMSGIAAVQPLYDRLKDLYLRSAELMPEQHYGFKPTPEVRTYGEILGHVANENYLFCAAAKSEENPNQADFEKTTAKAALVQAVKESFAYCDPAYRMDEMKAMEEITFFRQKGSRLWVLVFNYGHDSEHYGNIVTYLRMKGLVPPSSQGGM